MADLKDSASKIGEAFARDAEEIGDAAAAKAKEKYDGIKARPKVSGMVIGFGVVLVGLVLLTIVYG